MKLKTMSMTYDDIRDFMRLVGSIPPESELLEVRLAPDQRAITLTFSDSSAKESSAFDVLPWPHFKVA